MALKKSGSSGASLWLSAILRTFSLVTYVSVFVTPHVAMPIEVIYKFHAGYFGLNGVLEKPSIGSDRVPSIVFCVYQLMFAAITYVLLDRRLQHFCII